MKKAKHMMLIAVGILLVAACNNATKDTSSTEAAPKSDSASFDMSKAKATISDLDRQYEAALKKADTAALAAFYAPDALMLPPNSEPVKQDAIAALWGSEIRMGVKELKITMDDLTGDADILIETGRAEIYGDNNKLLDKGKYVVVYRPENGQWKIFRDIWNSSTPMAPAKK